MHRQLVYISLLAALFLNTTAANMLGVDMLTTAAFTPMLLLLVYKFVNKKISTDPYEIKNVYLLLILSAVILFVKFVTTGENFFIIVFRFTIVPGVVLLTFNSLKFFEKRIIQNIVKLFFLAECLLAILERVLSKRFFDTIYTSDRYDYAGFESNSWEFRSTSLLGHPLENGMAVAIMLSFILFSNLSSNKKILYFVIGYVSLFCFNARGATIIVSVMLLPFVGKLIMNKYKKLKIFSFLLAAGILGGMILIISQTSLGGRLFNADKLIDGSAETRIDVFSYIALVSNDDLLFGNTETYHNLLEKLDLVGIENGVITTIFLYGAILAIPLLLLLLVIQFKQLKGFKNYERAVILVVFWVIGTMNPNLIVPTQWYIFLFSYLAFKPESYNFKN